MLNLRNISVLPVGAFPPWRLSNPPFGPLTQTEASSIPNEAEAGAAREASSIFLKPRQRVFGREVTSASDPTGSCGYQRVAVLLAHFHRLFDESRTVPASVSLTISDIYLLFELCLFQIKHAI
jgi:hypothetical protein